MWVKGGYVDQGSVEKFWRGCGFVGEKCFMRRGEKGEEAGIGRREGMRGEMVCAWGRHFVEFSVGRVSTASGGVTGGGVVEQCGGARGRGSIRVDF